MTLRCSRSRSGRFPIATALSLLFTIAVGLAPSVVAQDNSNPPPRQGGAPDADFGVMQGQGQPGGDGPGFPPMMGRRRMRQGFGGDGQGFGPGPRGMGAGPDDNRGFGGPLGGRRIGGMGGMGGGHHALDFTPLNLTDDQKNRIQQFRKATREQARSTKQSLMQKQLQLRDLLFSADASDAKIRAARKEVRQAQEQLDDLNVEDLLKIRSVLTAEQKQKLPELKPTMQAGRGGMGGGRRMAGGAEFTGSQAPGGPGGRAQLGDRPGLGR